VNCGDSCALIVPQANEPPLNPTRKAVPTEHTYYSLGTRNIVSPEVETSPVRESGNLYIITILTSFQADIYS
jgi:hypothetical protein